MRNLLKNPYAWAGAFVFAVVAAAWFSRDLFEPVGAGSGAPAFEAVSLEGDTVALSDYRGQVVLLNIWATWCPPCVEEMPSMQRLSEIIEDPDFEVVAVSIDAGEGQRDASGNVGGDVEAFVEEYGLTFDILLNPSGSIQRIYQTTGVPESFVIGKDGIIYQKVTGPSEWDSPQNVALMRRLMER
ncbi:MAG: peroxiredoxin family protein [Gemmatimonadota bacterium]